VPPGSALELVAARQHRWRAMHHDIIEGLGPDHPPIVGGVLLRLQWCWRWVTHITEEKKMCGN
jgi:hypothetical protein